MRTMNDIRGFSLVELMISLVLGLVVIAAVGMVFLSSSRTSAATNSLSRAQESSRFSVQYIGRELRMAGYSTAYEFGVVSRSIVFPSNIVFTTPGQVIVGTDNSTAGGVLAGTDTIQLRYMGSASTAIPDCQGNAVNATTIVTIRMFVNEDNELVCTVDGGSEEVLIEDIGDLQLTYGVDTNNDNSVDSYVTAAAVTDWLDPVSVRLEITIDSDNAEITDRVITSVIALRNRLI